MKFSSDAVLQAATALAVAQFHAIREERNKDPNFPATLPGDLLFISLSDVIQGIARLEGHKGYMAMAAACSLIEGGDSIGNG